MQERNNPDPKNLERAENTSGNGPWPGLENRLDAVEQDWLFAKLRLAEERSAMLEAIVDSPAVMRSSAKT